MANSHTSDPSPQRFRRGARAAELLRNASFPMAVRGYDRRSVDDFLDQLRDLVDDLEAHQTREGVVQKALDELGEETAGILQRAHETADEIAARSRAQADGRLQRAEREADIVKRDADEYAEQVVVDTRLLWEERQRLVEDLRQLADEVLGTADDAIERLKLPGQLAATEQDGESTTSESPLRPIPHPLSIARSAEPDEEGSDPGIPYDLESPDPDAGASWDGEAEAVRWAGEEADPDATRPYAVEEECAAEDEADPDPTARWTAETEAEAAGDEAGPGSAGEAAGEDSDPHTVELEALPGGSTDEQAAEPERKRD